MAAPIVYVVGASGSGKDSLLRYARRKLASNNRIVFAHRYITRAAKAGGENHIALNSAEFSSRLNAGLFALSWHSHGLDYGIGIEINQWLAKGMTVVLNGSREYLSVAKQCYPNLVAVWIEVSTHILRQRLLSRGRESVTDIEKRLQHHDKLQSHEQKDKVISNNATLQQAGDELVELLLTQLDLTLCA